MPAKFLMRPFDDRDTGSDSENCLIDTDRRQDSDCRLVIFEKRAGWLR